MVTDTDAGLIGLRKALHQHPELSGRETTTAARVRDFVSAFEPDAVLENVGGHGLLAVYVFGPDGPTLLIRCELDALPIAEPNSFAHRSRREGTSHKCGHDGHMAIVAGLAPWLQRQSFGRGRVVLLFQPAEETGAGAKAVLEDPKFAAVRPDYVFALHNIPGAPLHQVIKVEGQFSATVQSVAIRLTGRRCHAAEPEKGSNPAWAMAEITSVAREWIVADTARPDFALITPVYTLMGQPDYGISAGYGELHFTLRTWTTARMQALVAQLEAEVTSACRRYGLTPALDYFDYFPAGPNAPRANDVISIAAAAADLEVHQQKVPFKFGEDFGWFTERFPGAMFGLGAGLETPPLHHDHYDFPDALLESGSKMFREVIRQLLA